VVSRLDHDANVRPWVQAAARAGATVRWAEFQPDSGELPAEQYWQLVTDRTRVVAITAASNAIGTRPDVASIAAVAHAARALVYVDGVHATPHAPTDVAALGADFYVTSAYKWSGPHIAACVAAPSLWESLRPEKLMPAPDTVPERFELRHAQLPHARGRHRRRQHPPTSAAGGRVAAAAAAHQPRRPRRMGTTSSPT
jgi:selenocysteine lyase/cysteine desulfurase